MTSVFEEVKTLVSMGDVARYYSSDPNRSGYICCPFHNEKTASLKLYDHDFHCFGCGAHGDAVDFVALLFNLEPMAAVKQLNNDFHLGISLDRPIHTEQLQQHRKVQDARQRFNDWRDQMLNQIDRAIRTANLADYHNMTEEEVLAIRYRESLIDWADTLQHGSIDEQMQVFRDREGVQRLCRTILKNTQTKSTAA